jgi:hypothetical protein
MTRENAEPGLHGGRIRRNVPTLHICENRSKVLRSINPHRPRKRSDSPANRVTDSVDVGECIGSRHPPYTSLGVVISQKALAPDFPS